MDQTKPTNKDLLWPIRECSQDTNLDCNRCISAHSHNQEKIGPENITLHFFTNCECDNFRKMPILQAFQDIDVQESKGDPCIQLNLFEI